MKRRQRLASGSAREAVALSIFHISHWLANFPAWMVGSTAAIVGPLGGFGLEHREAVAGIRNFDLDGFQIDSGGTAARVGPRDAGLDILSCDGRTMS